ncbi:L-rhamnose mutarotase [Chromohalobacter canadensis]|uniref:L-rhamnose mutarotase n=1 Tax=Chromohalobacter canadensis TaxID=141389 RepID=A0A285VXL8_9GAMM|nr:L-rhamnose mutarotase [Chromohalobacter canadensis]SOC57421.1 L-rhamnose mutarotase [Chromohalobacter canadensis]
MRYCLMLDLVDDEALIAEYEQRHREIWPTVREHLKRCGVAEMALYRLGTRLTMIMETDDARFSFEAMTEMERRNPVVQQWEAQMWRYQRPTPWTEENNKWQPMTPIFHLSEQ